MYLQQVVDLKSLMEDKKQILSIQIALTDEDFCTPFLNCLAHAIAPDKKPLWQERYLCKKTKKAPVKDLLQVQKALSDKKIPFKTTLRMMPSAERTIR
jgi:hypothetical protein